MRLAVLATAAALCAGPAFAGSASADTTSNAQQGGRVVYVCDRSDETRRGFSREHGAVTYISAAELAKAETAKETWAAPRCITAAELDKFERTFDGARVTRASNAEDAPARRTW